MARWNRIGSRGNVEDRRGAGPRVAGGVGGLGIVGVLIYLLLSGLGGGGGGFEDVLGELTTGQAPPQQQVDASEFEGADDYQVFVETVLGSNDDLWTEVFAEGGLEYTPARLVLFRDRTESACGGADARVGPHYCPLDETIYLDESFFDELQSRFGAEGGDVAEAYVIAHEVAHHVQNELDIMGEVQQLQQQSSQDERNQLSVALELQADCLAGVWANSIRDAGVFLPGEIDEAMDAAAAVGDDRIQETVQGRVTPENWTHGSSEERVRWFTVGYDGGDPSRCDTFS